MAQNKKAWTRYHLLDECFSNFQRKFDLESLTNYCNQKLIEKGFEDSTVTTRTIRNDIDFMKELWGFELEEYQDYVIKEGELNPKRRKNICFRYEDRKFSIRNAPLSKIEIEQLRESIEILAHYDGLPEFEWFSQMTTILNEKLDEVGDKNRKMLIFLEQNKEYTGLIHISRLYKAIIDKKCLKITYKNFDEKLPSDFLFSPSILKEYNKRWFCYGKIHNSPEKIWNFPLDRIEQIENTEHEYLSFDKDFDWQEFFDEKIGIIVPENVQKMEITFWVNKKLIPYLETKPLHWSQKMIAKENIFSVSLIPNYEFYSLILSHGEQIKIISPVSVKKEITKKIQAMYQNYKEV